VKRVIYFFLGFCLTLSIPATNLFALELANDCCASIDRDSDEVIIKKADARSVRKRDESVRFVSPWTIRSQLSRFMGTLASFNWLQHSPPQNLSLQQIALRI